MFKIQGTTKGRSQKLDSYFLIHLSDICSRSPHLFFSNQLFFFIQIKIFLRAGSCGIRSFNNPSSEVNCHDAALHCWFCHSDRAARCVLNFDISFQNYFHVALNHKKKTGLIWMLICRSLSTITIRWGGKKHEPKHETKILVISSSGLTKRLQSHRRHEAFFVLLHMTKKTKKNKSLCECQNN